MLVEILTFRLTAGTDAETFLEADRRVQVDFFHRRSGFLRRTTARGADGEWLVIVLWSAAADADAAAAAAEDHPAVAAFMAGVDGATVRSGRYETLD